MPLTSLRLSLWKHTVLPFVLWLLQSLINLLRHLKNKQKITPLTPRPLQITGPCPICHFSPKFKGKLLLAISNTTAFWKSNNLASTAPTAQKRLCWISQMTCWWQLFQCSASLLILFDLEAAFDAVDHHTLLQHLHNPVGLKGTVSSWLEFSLSNRSEHVDGRSKVSLTLLAVAFHKGHCGPSLSICLTSGKSSVTLRCFSSYADTRSTLSVTSCRAQCMFGGDKSVEDAQLSPAD